MTSRPTRTLAALRQLACLGLPGKSMLPEAIALLHSAIGFETVISFHFDEDCRIVDAHIPTPIPLAVMLDFYENFYDKPEGEGIVGITTREVLAGTFKAIKLSQFIERRKLMNSALYARIFRPTECGWVCQIPIRDGRRPLANILLSRPFALSDFSSAELRLIAQAQPWFCHALARRSEAPEQDTKSLRYVRESGVLLLDAAGKILSASPKALVLMHQAAGMPLNVGQLRNTLRGDLQELLRRFSSVIGAVFSGREAPRPAMVIRNEFGDFNLRAYAMDAFAPGQPMQVSLQIESRAPLPLWLFRQPRFLALSAREREICLGILAGRSQAEIAMQLGIKPSSAIGYGKALYRRLGVGSRRELLPALLGEAAR